jgi:hypothetical protein
MVNRAFVPASYEVVREHYKVQARRLCKGLRDPDDDVPMTIFLETDRGTTFVEVPPFRNQLEKEQVALSFLPEHIRRANARMFGFVSAVWYLDTADNEVWAAVSNNNKRISDHPARQEGIALFISDGSRRDAYIAKVQRRQKKRPSVGPWEDTRRLAGAAEGDAAFKGLFVEPLEAALRANRRTAA